MGDASSLTYDQLKALLEDTQASLAASFARIEAYRVQNRLIRNELSLLRNQVHGAAAGQPAGAADNLNKIERIPSTPCSIAFPQEKNAVGPNYTNVNSGPTYVTDVLGEHTVTILSGGRKAPASLIVTKDFIDFVESKARVSSHDFVGITTLKGSTGSTDTANAPSTSNEGKGTWQILWNKDNIPQRLVFEASQATRTNLHKHTERWLGVDDPEAADGEYPVSGDPGDLAPPKNLVIGDAALQLVGEPSQLLSADHLHALGSAIPPLERMRPWSLSYSTSKHGISLSTLYRRMVSNMPTVLVIKDNAGYLFGCYTPDPWRVAPRFYGRGETFVFQLEPHRVMYPWRSMSNVKNDFFQYATPDCLALGGLGHFAIHVDSELLQGSSGTCGTFGSPCLAGSEEFKVNVLEVWQTAQ